MKKRRFEKPLTLEDCLRQIEEGVQTALEYTGRNPKALLDPVPCCSWLIKQLEIGTFGFDTDNRRLFMHRQIGYINLCPNCAHNWGRNT